MMRNRKDRRARARRRGFALHWNGSEFSLGTVIKANRDAGLWQPGSMKRPSPRLGASTSIELFRFHQHKKQRLPRRSRSMSSTPRDKAIDEKDDLAGLPNSPQR